MLGGLVGNLLWLPMLIRLVEHVDDGDSSDSESAPLSEESFAS